MKVVTKAELSEVLRARQEEMTSAWARRIRQSSDRYQLLTIEEIERSVRELVLGLAMAIESGDYGPLSASLTATGTMRAASGFEPAEVQRALLMGCDAAYPVLEEAFGANAQDLVWSVTQVEKALHRSLNLLQGVMKDAQVQQRESEAEYARHRLERTERRLQALLKALGIGAIAVDRDKIVTWTDEIGGSARCGLLTRGEVINGEAAPGLRADILTEALVTGRTHRAKRQGECDIWMAFPVFAEDGQLLEVMGLLGRPNPVPSEDAEA